MNHRHAREPLLGLLAILATAFIFGLSFMFTKKAVDTISVYALLSWRFLIAIAVLLLLRLFGIIRTNFRGKRLMPLVWLSLIHPVTYFIAEANALADVASMEAGLFIATIPIVTMILAAVFLKEKSTLLQRVSIVVSVVGIVVISLGGQAGNGESKLKGFLFLALAVIAGSVFTILSKQAAAFTSVEKTIFMMGSGAVVFLALALREQISMGTLPSFLTLPLQSTDLFLTLLYLGVVTSAFAFVMQNYAIQILGATRSASFSPLSTLISIVAGALFLKEPVTVYLVVGAILILLGVIGANRRPAA